MDSAPSQTNALAYPYPYQLPSPVSLLPSLIHLCLDYKLLGNSWEVLASQERLWARVCSRLYGDCNSTHSSHGPCAWARKRAACKCLQGSSATLPLMLNKVLKSKPPCKCCSYYQVGVLWFSSKGAQLLKVAGATRRSWMFDIQLCREQTDIRAWHTAMKEDAIWFGKLAPAMMQLPYVPRCQISNGAEWPDPDL